MVITSLTEFREVIVFPKQSRFDFDACQRGIKNVVLKEVERLDVQSFVNENRALRLYDGSLLG